jgi:hypothetical protein
MIVRTRRNPFFLSLWLLVYLSVAQTTIGHFVLCFEQDGRFTLEAGKCPCHANLSESSSLQETIKHHYGSCKDITPTTDIPRMTSPSRPIHSFFLALFTYPEAPYHSSNTFFAVTCQSIPPDNHSIHPAISTTILLI